MSKQQIATQHEGNCPVCGKALEYEHVGPLKGGFQQGEARSWRCRCGAWGNDIAVMCYDHTVYYAPEKYKQVDL
jgi:hypothetical protein